MTTATEERATVTVTEAAEMLGIGKSLAYELARSGELPGVIKLGSGVGGRASRYVVSRRKLDELLGNAAGSGEGQSGADN